LPYHCSYDTIITAGGGKMKTLEQAIQEFIEAKEASFRSPATIKKYSALQGYLEAKFGGLP